MLKIFLSSHGHFASGMKSSLDILLGDSSKVTIYDAYVDESNVQEQLDNFYTKINEDDQILLLSDLYGGSVNQVMYLYLERPNTMLVAGVNLALVLELAIRESITVQELEDLVQQSREMLRVVRQDNDEVQIEEDFF